MNKYIHAIIIGLFLSFLVAISTACGTIGTQKPRYTKNPLQIYSATKVEPARSNLRAECPECVRELQERGLVRPTFRSMLM